MAPLTNRGIRLTALMFGFLLDPFLRWTNIMTIISMPYLVHVMMRQMDDCSVRGWRHGCGRHIGSPEDGSLLVWGLHNLPWTFSQQDQIIPVPLESVHQILLLNHVIKKGFVWNRSLPPGRWDPSNTGSLEASLSSEYDLNILVIVLININNVLLDLDMYNHLSRENKYKSAEGSYSNEYFPYRNIPNVCSSVKAFSSPFHQLEIKFWELRGGDPFRFIKCTQLHLSKSSFNRTFFEEALYSIGNFERNLCLSRSFLFLILFGWAVLLQEHTEGVWKSCLFWPHREYRQGSCQKMIQRRHHHHQHRHHHHNGRIDNL